MVREELDQERAIGVAADEVRALHVMARRAHRARQVELDVERQVILREDFLGLLHRELGDEAPARIERALPLGEEDELVGLQRDRDRGRDVFERAVEHVSRG